MKSKKPIDIVLVTWNRPKLTEQVLIGIEKNTKRENYRLIVVDNGSEEPTRKLIEKYTKNGVIDEIIASPTNLGLEPARNAGLAAVKNDNYFICADNDCIPQPMVDGKDWVELLVDLMDRHPKYAAISCRTQVMIGTGNIFEHADEDGSEIVDFPHPGGSLRIMRTAPVRGVGGWRDYVDGRGTEERYICGELHKKKWKTAFAVKIKTLHLFGDKSTDRWGYPKDWKPEDTGHSDIWHPVLDSGDDPEEIKKWIGES